MLDPPLTCSRCESSLTADEFALSMITRQGTRRVYECSCGGVTVTVVRGER